MMMMMMMMMMIRKVIVVPVVIGALRAISVNFKEYMNMRLEVIQKIALLGTAKMLRMWQEEKERPGTHGDLL